MNYIIFDLEATCWENNFDDRMQETIEIGAFLLSPYGEVVGEYNRFIKPKLYPELSVYCKELTSITQDNVNRAGRFDEVIEEFQDWAGVFEQDYKLCSWGSFDRKQLISDCKLFDLEYEWVYHHINLKSQYQEMKRLNRSCSLINALRREGIEFTGIHHRGISDAENLSKIFTKYLDEWQV